MSDETLKREVTNKDLWIALTGMNGKIDKIQSDLDSFKTEVSQHLEVMNIQLETVRQGIVQNSVAYDRLKAEVLLLRADVKELTEEARRNRKVLA